MKEIADITTIAAGYQKALILQVAVKNGLFTYLLKRRKVVLSEIASDFGWNKRSTRIFLNALTGMGFLLKDGDSYRNSKASEEHLVESKEYYAGDIIKHQYNILRGNWINLENSLVTGKPAVDREVEKRDEDEIKNFILGMSNIAKLSVNMLLPVWIYRDSEGCWILAVVRGLTPFSSARITPT